MATPATVFMWFTALSPYNSLWSSRRSVMRNSWSMRHEASDEPCILPLSLLHAIDTYIRHIKFLDRAVSYACTWNDQKQSWFAVLLRKALESWTLLKTSIDTKLWWHNINPSYTCETKYSDSGRQETSQVCLWYKINYSTVSLWPVPGALIIPWLNFWFAVSLWIYMIVL